MNSTLSIKAALRALCGLAIVVALALSSLWLADGLRDPAAIRAAVSQAFADHRLGDEEGVERFGYHRTSHFSECVGLSTTILPKAANGLWFTLQSPALLWQAPKPICRSLENEASGQEQPYFAYSRYWHGYRLITEPVLSYLSYASLQDLCGFLLVAGAALCVVAAASLSSGTARPTIRSLAAPCIALLLLSVSVDWPGIGHTPTHAISISILLLCWAWAMSGHGAQRSELDRVLPAAFIMGAIYNFFDFLYNPDLLAFLLGWSYFMRAACTQGRALRPALVGAVIVQGVAIMGYMAMWAIKWGLARLGGDLLGEKTFMPTQDFNRWVAGGEEAYVPFKATYALLVDSARMPFGLWPLIGCAMVLCALLVLAFLRGRSAGVFAVIALTLFPLLLLELKANHTFMHAAFTFRFVPFAVVLTTLGAALMLRRRQDMPGTP